VSKDSRQVAPATTDDIARWTRNLQREWANADTLRAMAERVRRSPDAGERGARLAKALEDVAARELRQADHWASKLAAARAPLPARRFTGRDRLILQLARWGATRSLLPVVAADALQGVERYRLQADAAPILASEVQVARSLAALARGPAARQVAEAGREHRRSTAGNGSLRAAVFGVNDGLTSNLSLVMGVAGAAPDNQWILLSGLAGLLAGAFSMGGGEFISMLSQRELFEREIALERVDIQTDPEFERTNLTRIYQEKGLARDEAETVAARLMSNPDVALDTIAREQLGLNPDELGSPRAAAVASFVSFALGATLPILPFLFWRGEAAIGAAVVLCALGLFGVGGLLSLFTARSPIRSGLRMVAVGLGAAAATYLIGRLIGVSVGG
jgi:VIT1/CCC1 family predicted Fe2+/Mn2+ transporter